MTTPFRPSFSPAPPSPSYPVPVHSPRPTPRHRELLRKSLPFILVFLSFLLGIGVGASGSSTTATSSPNSTDTPSTARPRQRRLRRSGLRLSPPSPGLRMRARRAGRMLVPRMTAIPRVPGRRLRLIQRPRVSTIATAMRPEPPAPPRFIGANPDIGPGWTVTTMASPVSGSSQSDEVERPVESASCRGTERCIHASARMRRRIPPAWTAVVRAWAAGSIGSGAVEPWFDEAGPEPF